MTAAVALAAGCAAAVALLLNAERRGSRGRYLAKPAASLCFVALGALALSRAADAYAGWIVAGLILGAAGDLALMLRGRRSFVVGLVLFLFGHLAYVVACAQLVAPAAWLAVRPETIVPIAAGAIALAYLWPHLGSMRAPVIAYVAVITAMVIAAVAVLRDPAAVSTLGGARAAALAIGAGLFFASDLAVARERFVRPGFENRAWGLPAYYGGQVLIAWSALP
jgi:uncharacterized membrane protein YhhN